MVLAALEDAKANDVRQLDVRRLTDITDWMVVASGTSTRHVLALADHVRTQVKARGLCGQQAAPFEFAGVVEGGQGAGAFAQEDQCIAAVERAAGQPVQEGGRERVHEGFEEGRDLRVGGRGGEGHVRGGHLVPRHPRGAPVVDDYLSLLLRPVQEPLRRLRVVPHRGV